MSEETGDIGNGKDRSPRVPYMRGWQRVRNNDNIFVNTSTGETIDRARYDEIMAEKRALREGPRPAASTVEQLRAEIETLRELIIEKDGVIASLLKQREDVSQARELSYQSGFRSAIDAMHDYLVEMSNA